MGMLDDLLKQAQPGVNPQLEATITRLMQASGASPGQISSGVQGLQGQPAGPVAGAAGTSAPPGQAAPDVGSAQQNPQANATYRALIQAGVPAAVAMQAMQDPKLLQSILAQMSQKTGPQEQGPMAPSAASPSRMSAPPLGGGGGGY
jgi:hypothetical protein